MPEKKAVPKKVKRPDGLSIDRYKGHEKWSYRRWAWEFLRRNEDFIAACDALDRQEKAEAEIAEEFHLQNFKHYKRPYKSDGNPAPKFIVRMIGKRTKLTAKELGGKPVKMNTGQVWLRFDLNHEFIVRGSLDAQLRVAKRSLNLALKEYTETFKKQLPKKKKPDRSGFVDLLRRLDAVAGSDVKWKGLAALYPKEFHNLDSDQRSKLAGSKMRSARLHAKETYLTLAIHAEK
jgi:hypothetical protein